VNLYSTQH